jgi:tetratricopeptide (TPR) repeat protein
MKSKTLRILVLLLIILGGCGDTATEYFKRASKYARKGKPEDWERAIKEYEKIITLKIEAYDRVAYLHRRLGDLFLEREMFKKAEEHYLAALEILPNVPEIHCSLGIVYANLGITEPHYFDKAIRSYEKAILLRPDYARPYYGVGLVYFYKKGLRKKGIERLQKAIELSPEYVEAHVALGQMYYEEGEFEKAIREYEKAISHSPKGAKILATYYTNIGVVYIALGNRELAIHNFKQALRINRLYQRARDHLKALGVELKDRWER